MDNLVQCLCDPARPVFLFGSTPPREGTTDDEARAIAEKFVARSWVLASDGFVVYDIQDEAGRTDEPRPFPFRRTVDPSGFGGILSAMTGKSCVIYKCAVEHSQESFDKWLDMCKDKHGHSALNLVGAATSKNGPPPFGLRKGAARVVEKEGMAFGCVTIAERHLTKGTEHLNIMRKQDLGAQWFISQAVYDEEATIKLLNDYGELCRERGILPKKVVLTFAPCGRKKTMSFIKWLGIKVPAAVEDEILANAPDPGSSLISAAAAKELSPEKQAERKQRIADVQRAAKVSVGKCLSVLSRCLENILCATATSGVPLSINVESVSIYKEEIDAAHDLFQVLQRKLLDHRSRLWSVRWMDVSDFSGGDEDGDSNKLAPTGAQALPLIASAASGAFITAVAMLYLAPALRSRRV